MARREMGKITFLDLVDRSGRIQLISEKVDVDLGDIVGVQGTSGEVSPGRAVAEGRRLRAAREEPRAAAGHVPRSHRRRAAVPKALPRPADERGDARGLPPAQPHRLGDPAPPRRRRLRRGRDAGAATALRRRLRRAVRHALELPRAGLLSPDRDRALPEAADRRRARARLRDRQGLPQRGHLVQALERVHDARVVRGVRGLQRHDGADGAADRSGRARGDGDDEDDLQGSRGRPEGALEAGPLHGCARRARPLDPRRVAAARRAERARGGHQRRQGLGAARSTTLSATTSSRA